MGIFETRIRPTVLAKLKGAPACNQSLVAMAAPVLDGEHFYLNPADAARFEAHWCNGCYLNNANCLEQQAVRDGSIASDLLIVDGKPACVAFDPEEESESVEVVEVDLVPTWAKAEQIPAILFDGKLRRYWARLSVPEFKRSGDDEFSEDCLDVRVLAYRWIREIRWGGKSEQYFDLAFVDADNVASCLSLTRDSAVAVNERLRSVVAAGAAVAATRLRLRFNQPKHGLSRVEVEESGFVSEFEFRLAQEFLESPNWKYCAWAGVWS